jgi:hypothetical protein
MSDAPHLLFCFAPLNDILQGVLLMCRSIKQLRVPDRPPRDQEIEAAAMQFVRKVSGYRVPSRANAAAFDRAVQQISAATRQLLDNLVAKS